MWRVVSESPKSISTFNTQAAPVLVADRHQPRYRLPDIRRRDDDDKINDRLRGEPGHRGRPDVLNPVPQSVQRDARPVAKPSEHRWPLRVVVDDHDGVRHLPRFSPHGRLLSTLHHQAGRCAGRPFPYDTADCRSSITTMGFVDADRAVRVVALQQVLNTAVSGSRRTVVGSLASGTADQYSDLDLRWEIGAAAAAVVKNLYDILGRLAPVVSLRWDTTDSNDTRLAFVRFSDWPLFSRVDLQIVGLFSGVPVTGTWSATESALMNVVGALKAHLRDRQQEVGGLLQRGFARISLPDPGGAPSARMRHLVDAVAEQDPGLQHFAATIKAAVDELLP